MYSCDETTYPQSVLANYDIVMSVIGVGGFGHVSLVSDKKTKEKLALKTIQFPQSMTAEQVCKEVSILQQLDHPCVIHLSDCKVSETHLFILLEYMAGGDLASRLRRKGVLTERQTKIIMYQLCLALQYLHDRTIIHCDIKPANILLADDSDECLVKLTDFGMSQVKEFDHSKNVLKGTKHYMAPEVYVQMKYTNKVDIWSSGVILYECLKGTRPPATPDWSSVPEFTKCMLEVNPDKRPDVEEILEQSWFKDDIKQHVESLIRDPKRKSTLEVPRELRDFGNQGFYYVCPQGSSYIENNKHNSKDNDSSSSSGSDSSTSSNSSDTHSSSSEITDDSSWTDTQNDEESSSFKDSVTSTGSDSSEDTDSNSSDSYYLNEETQNNVTIKIESEN